LHHFLTAEKITENNPGGQERQEGRDRNIGREGVADGGWRGRRNGRIGELARKKN